MTCCPTCGHEIEADAGVHIDGGRLLVTAPNGVVKLTFSEFVVFRAMFDRFPGVVRRGAIYDDLCSGRGADMPAIKVVDLYVSKIRRKLKPIGISVINHHSVGFSLEIQSEAQHVR